MRPVASVSLEPKHLPAIDALRGLAFLGVLAVHTSQHVGHFPGIDLFRLGRHGVQLFFVASALTLCRSFDARRQAQHPLLGYAVRRAFRIVPMFWVGIVLYLVLQGTGPRHFAPDGVAAWHVVSTALMLHAWHPDAFNNVVPGGWSIGVEVAFYVVLPFLAARLRSWPVALAATAVVVALSVPLRTATLAYLEPRYVGQEQLAATFAEHWFPMQLSVFLLGVVVHHVLCSPRAVAALSAPGRPTLLIAGAGASYAGFAYAGRGPLPPDFVFGVVAAVLVLGVTLGAPRLLVNRWTCRLGELSYSAYIVHFAAVAAVARVAERFGPPPGGAAVEATRYAVIVAVALLLTVGAARLTYALVERPGMALGRRLIERLERR